MQNYKFDELNEAELQRVVGGICGENGINWEVFTTTLIEGGAQDIPALAELMNCAVNRDWQRVASILPKFLTNKLVLNAFNAACRG